MPLSHFHALCIHFFPATYPLHVPTSLFLVYQYTLFFLGGGAVKETRTSARRYSYLKTYYRIQGTTSMDIWLVTAKLS